MAFCQACGAEVLDTAVVCIKCGSPLKKDSNICESAAEAWPKNKMWMYGILSFIIPIVGIIIVVVFAYSSSTGELLNMPGYTGPDNVKSTLKWSETGLLVTYVFMGLAVLSIIYAEIAKMFK